MPRSNSTVAKLSPLSLDRGKVVPGPWQSCPRGVWTGEKLSPGLFTQTFVSAAKRKSPRRAGRQQRASTCGLISASRAPMSSAACLRSLQQSFSNLNLPLARRDAPRVQFAGLQQTEDRLCRHAVEAIWPSDHHWELKCRHGTACFLAAMRFGSIEHQESFISPVGVLAV